MATPGMASPGMAMPGMQAAAGPFPVTPSSPIFFVGGVPHQWMVQNMGGMPYVFAAPALAAFVPPYYWSATPASMPAMVPGMVPGAYGMQQPALHPTFPYANTAAAAASAAS